jgi:shikimate kinase
VTEQPHSIFLIGPMGAGKTTIGKRLARALKRRFVDCDHEIEKKTGASIPLIFEIEGESGFRAREKRVIDDLSQEPGVVLATGGGAVLDPENRQRLSERGLVVFLYAPVELLVARTRNDTNRPLLQTGNRAERLREIMLQREPLYREIADLTVDTGAMAMGEIVSTIKARAS